MAELKRVAGYGTIIALTIGSVMGTGLFIGPAIGAELAGNASIISWLILSVISLYVAFCFGELVAMFPRAGGVYEFGKQTYGRFFSFIIGWLAWIVGNIGTVVLIVVGVEYLIPGNKFLIFKVVISCLFLLALNLVSLFGIEGSSAMVVIFTTIMISVILAVLIPGIPRVNFSNYTPFFNSGFTGILATVFFIAESFFGWEAASYLAEETKNPERVIPRSLIISTALVCFLALLTVIMMLGVIPAKELARSSAPFIDVARVIFSSVSGANLGRVIDAVGIGVYLTMIGCAAGSVITMPRLILALSRDRLFLKQFAEIHPKFFTPHKAIYFQFVVSLVILVVGFGNYQTLLGLLIPLGFAMYASVLLSVPILRIKRPEIKREFKAPLGNVLPFVIVVFFIMVIVMWLISTPNAVSLFLVGLSLIFLGIPLYLLIEIYNDPETIADVNDFLAYLTLFTEKLNVPESVLREIMSHMGDVRGKTVLEFGCGVGTLTLRISEAVGPEGMIYATSFSKNHIKITKRRLDNQSWDSDRRIFSKVRLIHDTLHTSRVHPEVRMVNAVVSVGMLGYIQDVEKVLKELNSRLPEEGRVCFMDYGDFFNVLPNVDWLENNEKIEGIFRKCGFSVQVKRKRGLFWNYIFIYGMKSKKDVLFI